MTKTLLSGAAAITFMFAATTAFTQDARMDTKVDVEETMDTAEEAMDEITDAAEEAEDMANEAIDEAEDALEDTAETVDNAVNANVDIDVDTSTTDDCPEGTERQDDGSCMIVGDWTPEG